MSTKGKLSKKVVKDKESKASVETEVRAKSGKEAKRKKEKASEAVTVTEVAEVTEPLVAVETEEVERAAEPVEEVRPEEIAKELRELKPKGVMKVVVGPPRLTRFERARLVGARALQLSQGAPPLVPVSDDTSDAITIATHELEQIALPISLRRVLPNGQYQDIPIRWLLEN